MIYNQSRQCIKAAEQKIGKRPFSIPLLKNQISENVRTLMKTRFEYMDNVNNPKTEREDEQWEKEYLKNMSSNEIMQSIISAAHPESTVKKMESEDNFREVIPKLVELEQEKRSISRLSKETKAGIAANNNQKNKLKHLIGKGSGFLNGPLYSDMEELEESYVDKQRDVQKSMIRPDSRSKHHHPSSLSASFSTANASYMKGAIQDLKATKIFIKDTKMLHKINICNASSASSPV